MRQFNTRVRVDNCCSQTVAPTGQRTTRRSRAVTVSPLYPRVQVREIELPTQIERSQGCTIISYRKVERGRNALLRRQIDPVHTDLMNEGTQPTKKYKGQVKQAK